MWRESGGNLEGIQWEFEGWDWGESRGMWENVGERVGNLGVLWGEYEGNLRGI